MQGPCGTIFGFALSREWRVCSAHAILRMVWEVRKTNCILRGAGVIEGRSVAAVGGRRAVLQVAVRGRLTFVPPDDNRTEKRLYRVSGVVKPYSIMGKVGTHTVGIIKTSSSCRKPYTAAHPGGAYVPIDPTYPAPERQSYTWQMRA